MFTKKFSSQTLANLSSKCLRSFSTNRQINKKLNLASALVSCYFCITRSSSSITRPNTNKCQDQKSFLNSSNLDIRCTNSFENLSFVLNQKNLHKLKTQKDKLSKKNLKYLLRSNFYSRMTNPTVNYFAHSFIDRCSDKRKDSKWIEDHMQLDSSVFVLFHIDKPFVSVHDSKNMYSLCKFNYSSVKQLLEKDEATNQFKCTNVFLGVEYEKNAQNDQTGLSLCHSPYSNPNTYNKNSYKAWFAIDTSGYDLNIENVSKLFASHGQFFEGNFLRLMAIQDMLESSIIAQVSLIF